MEHPWLMEVSLIYESHIRHIDTYYRDSCQTTSKLSEIHHNEIVYEALFYDLAYQKLLIGL